MALGGAPLIFGRLDFDDERVWRRRLDYYFRLHELNDAHSARSSSPRRDRRAGTTPSSCFTSDHGEQCRRRTGCVARARSRTRRSCTSRWSCARPESPSRGRRPTRSRRRPTSRRPRRARGLGADDPTSMSGVDSTPVLAGDGSASATTCCSRRPRPGTGAASRQRFALRGVFDGRHKYVRYFGVGGGVDNLGAASTGRRRCASVPTPSSGTRSTSCTTCGGPRRARQPGRRPRPRTRCAIASKPAQAREKATRSCTRAPDGPHKKTTAAPTPPGCSSMPPAAMPTRSPRSEASLTPIERN